MGSLVRQFGKILVNQPESLHWATTTWGEEARVLVSPIHQGQGSCLMDYRAPAQFGPPRHIHFRDDEVLRIVSGKIVVWSPEACTTAGPGDLVILPKGLPHTWRSLDKEVHMEVMTTPGDLELFFQRLNDLKAEITDINLLNAVSEQSAVENIGPRLSNEDVRRILAGEMV